MQFLFDEAEFVAGPMPQPRPRGVSRLQPWHSEDFPIAEDSGDPPWPAQAVRLRLLV